jgi:hypothetical protein
MAEKNINMKRFGDVIQTDSVCIERTSQLNNELKLNYSYSDFKETNFLKDFFLQIFSVL